MSSLEYAHEKFGNAVRSMATSDCTVKNRIDAAIAEFHVLGSRHCLDSLPRKIASKIEKLLASVNLVEATASEDSTMATLNSMSPEELHDLALQIFDLYDEMDRAYHEMK
jgi:hypothetical protein